MNSNWIYALVAVVLVAIAGAFYLTKNSQNSGNGQQPTDTRQLKTYYDQRYGIAFNFPDSYTVTEREVSTKHHTIVVMDKVAADNVPSESDGPPSVTFDIFSSPSTLKADAWIKNTQDSNYHLSNNAELAPTTVNGIPAFAYPWDGLYQSLSIVFPHANRIYMASVGYNAPTDQIYKDFATIVASIQLDP